MDTVELLNLDIPAAPSRTKAFKYWLKLGFISFGGPAGQIAMMHQELVDRRRWISEQRFLHALNYCMLLPGPEAIQLAIYISWLMHGTVAAIVAGVLFFLPAFVLLSLLAAIYLAFGDVPLNLEYKLEVWDSPNSAGIIIDAVRAAKIAKDRGIGGPIIPASAYLMKSPPKQLADDVARAQLEEFIAGER